MNKTDIIKPKSKQANILIVEDSLTQAEKLKHLLETNNYKTSIASHGQDALDKLCDLRPDLIISDIHMPVMDGYEMCRIIKYDDKLKDIPIILLTSFEESKDIARGLEVNADYYYTKPYDDEFLLSRINLIFSDPPFIKKGNKKEAVELFFEGEHYFILASYQQMLTLLVSIYENAVQKKRELQKSNQELLITHHKLEMSKDSFHSIVEKSDAGILVLDNNNLIKYFNPTVETLLDYSKNDLLGKAFNFPVAVNSPAEIDIVRQDRSPGSGEIRTIETEWHGEKALLMSINDVTVRKQAELELQKNYETQKAIANLLSNSLKDISLEEILEKALELLLALSWCNNLSKGSIFFIDKKQNCLKMKAQIGLPDMMAKKCSQVDLDKCECGFSSQQTEILTIESCKIAKTCSPDELPAHNHLHIPIISGDETLGLINIYVEKTLKFHAGEKEILTIFANALSEIIQRRQAEEEQKNLMRQLIQAQKMDAIGSLSGGIAHDFNNILTTIKGFAQVGMMTADKSNPLYKNMEEINKAADIAASLTRKLLLFSRQQTMEFISFNINVVIKSLIKILQRLIGENITVKTDLDPICDMIKADQGSIEQVMINLAVNARDAMLNMNGNLHVKTENVNIDENYCKQLLGARVGKFIRISISDTGTGMDKNIMEHIFEPFFTTKEKGKGTGFGLSVVHGIIKQHKGWINVYSEVGEGSTFKIYLPATKEKFKRIGEKEITLHELQGHGKRLLLVEDQKEILEFCTIVFQENGYQVFSVKNAKSALDVFEKENGNIDLVFSDMHLEDTNGLELVEDLITRKPGIKALLSSGYTDEKSHWPLIKEKQLPFVHKPYNIKQLLKKVKEIIEEEGETINSHH